MNQQLQKLMFSISMADQVSGPASKIQKSLNSTASSAKSAFSSIGIGAAGMVGAGVALQSLLMPAIEMDRALGEVKSLGVAQDALDQLSNTALDFSVAYGKSAADFVSSSYDIQSAIGGLTGSELSKFTEAGGVLAAATKASTGTITDYMGKMYNVFQKSANAMGKDNWVQLLAGQTASAVQMFSTTGDKMSAAFSSIGANATSAGVAMHEQMAILGTLQGTMSGSEAGTKYKSFLAGVGKAQDALGLKFTDSSGQMLGMVDILGSLKGKFGDTLDVAESDALKSAFGSSEAVSLIKQLMTNTDGLAGSISQLGKVSGMSKAEKMAAAMVDPWERLGSGVKAVSIGFGRSLLPVINPLIDSMANGTKTLTRWSQLFPNLTKWVGGGVVAVLGLTAGLAALTVVSGLSSGAMLVWGAGAAVVSGITATLSAVMKTFRLGMLAVNLVMYANPIGLVVAGIAALTVGIGAAIYWWDDLKSAFLDTTWGKGLMVVIGGITSYFKTMGGIASKVIDWVIEKVNMIPGVEIGGGESEAPNLNTVNSQLKTAAVSPGQVTNNISRAVSNNSNQSSNHTTINTTQSPTPQLMDGWLAMEAF